LVDSAYAVLVERDILYGTETRFNGATDSLRLDVYVPRDAPAPRPLMLWIHGGAFLEGHRRDMASWCQRWAERGYVAVTASYRLGFYAPFPFDPPFAYDQAEVVRASYRAVQDIRGALRYVVANAEQWGVDTGRVVIAGASAGAITALHHAILDPSDQSVPAGGALDDVVRGFDRFPRPDLGSLDGPLNREVSDPTIDVVVSLFGGITRLDDLNGAPLPAMYLYHQNGDLIVSCNSARGLWGMPLGVGDNFPVLHGSCVLREEFRRRSLRTDRWQVTIHEGLGHEVHDVPAIDHEAAEFCSRILLSTVSVDGGQGTTDNGSTSRVGSWVAYSILGEVIASGTGTRHDALQAVQLLRSPYSVLRFGDTLLWLMGNEVDHRR
jgi:hypothetical protein